jgi:hypothetical protein
MVLTKLEVTVCSARNLPNVDGMWGSCDTFLVLDYQNQTHTSTVLSAVSASCFITPLALRPLRHPRHVRC